MFCNMVSIDWMSKSQASISTSVFGFELVVQNDGYLNDKIHPVTINLTRLESALNMNATPYVTVLSVARENLTNAC